MKVYPDYSRRLRAMMRFSNFVHLQLDRWMSGVWTPTEWQKLSAFGAKLLFTFFDKRIDRRTIRERRAWLKRHATPDAPWVVELFYDGFAEGYNLWTPLSHGPPTAVPSSSPHGMEHSADVGPYSFTIAVQKAAGSRGRVFTPEIPCRLHNLVTGQIVIV